jgi:hypothetical protein
MKPAHPIAAWEPTQKTTSITGEEFNDVIGNNRLILPLENCMKEFQTRLEEEERSSNSIFINQRIKEKKYN